MFSSHKIANKGVNNGEMNVLCLEYRLTEKYGSSKASHNIYIIFYKDNGELDRWLEEDYIIL